MAELGPVGYRIILENNLVRVWEVALDPGQKQALHHHEHPYLVIAVTDGKNVVESIDGTKRDASEPAGGVVFREAGDTHTLTNVGETRYVSRLVELKDVVISRGRAAR